MATELSLVERRDSQPLDDHVWDELRADPEFWSLVDNNIIQVKQLSNGVALRPMAYVGRALAGDVELRIDPKIDGALEALIGFASRGHFRLERVHAWATPPGDLTELLVDAFLDAVGRYLQFGIDFTYEKRPGRGLFLRGQLDVPRTLRLHAQGQPLHVAFTTRFQSRSTSLNLLVAAALLHAERIALTMDQVRQRGRARHYLLAFPLGLLDSARDPSAVPEADELELTRSIERDAAELATAVLAAAGFEAAAPLIDRTVPRSWFINLETLFEQAVRSTLRRMPGVVSVRNGTHENRYVFPHAPSGVLDATPDLLIELAGVLVVGDVKYKEWVGTAAPSDLYQLLVHAGTFESDDALLIYPGPDFQVVDLGRSRLGISTRLVSVRPAQLSEDLERLAAELLPLVGGSSEVQRRLSST